MYDQQSIKFVHKFFWHPKFLKLADIRNLTQTEQDRIFNELILASLILTIMILEDETLRSPQETKIFMKKVAKELPKTHVNYIKELGVEKEYQNLWTKLIQMRYEELKEDIPKARYATLVVHKIKTPEELNVYNQLMCVQTISVCSFHHIVRGETKDREELFLLIHRWLAKCFLEIRVPLEIGGPISNFLRIRMKVTKTLRKLFG